MTDTVIRTCYARYIVRKLATYSENENKVINYKTVVPLSDIHLTDSV